LLVEVFVDERTLLEATRHKSVLQSALLAGPATPHDVLVALLVRPACAAFQLTPRADWVPTTRGPALATALRVGDRLHRDTARGRASARLPAGVSRGAGCVAVWWAASVCGLCPSVAAPPPAPSSFSPCGRVCRARLLLISSCLSPSNSVLSPLPSSPSINSSAP